MKIYLPTIVRGKILRCLSVKTQVDSPDLLKITNDKAEIHMKLSPVRPSW